MLLRANHQRRWRHTHHLPCRLSRSISGETRTAQAIDLSVPARSVGGMTSPTDAVAAAMPAPRAEAASGFHQGTFDELGMPLSEATFVVVDLETTGGAPSLDAITEIGAVKVRGGEVLGEFQTLVHPGEPIPPFIAVLTGITDAMVAHAPGIHAVLPAFLEFARGAILVAHNAPFDIGFLRAAAETTGHPWPATQVLDTALLARRIVTADEAPNCRLATLARVFHASTVPIHRALADARATVDVLHGLLERLGNRGVRTVEELATWQSAVTPAQRRKRHLAEALPHAPGVYVFQDLHGTALYVGKSRDLRTRVRAYFSASETRARMTEMIAVAEFVVGIECATDLEAEVRELRMIAEHKPRYNRRSRFPERGVWLKLTAEAFPRLSVVPDVRPDAASYVGPFGSRRQAMAAVSAVHDAVPLRQCTDRLGRRPRRTACALAEIGRCGAPCTGAQSQEEYAQIANHVRDAFCGDPQELVRGVTVRIDRLAARQWYEEAAQHRDRLATLLRTAQRSQRVAGLAKVTQLVAAGRRPEGGWEVHVVRYGRLAAAAVTPPEMHPQPYIDALLATAEVVTPPPLPKPAALVEETECVLRWLERDGVRLVAIDGEWACPWPAAGAFTAYTNAAERDRAAANPIGDRRTIRPLPHPIITR
jgi:DNA polymerase III subunit epsilon